MSESGEEQLSLIDYIVLGSTLAISALIGIYYNLTGGRQRTTDEYLLGDKQMSIFPVSFSLMASFMSAITLLGVTAENYMFGTQFVAINISYIFGTPIAAFLFLPVFYQLKVTSVYEYLEIRFDRRVRVMASLVFMIQMIIYMSIVLYAPALALSAVTGISKWASIISVGLVCTLYCTIGGIKAVLWTDVFQSFLMFTAMLIIIIKGTLDVGGVDIVWQRAVDGQRIEFFNLDPNPMTRHTFWSLSIGGIFIFVSLYGVNQTQVQRLLTVKTLKKSQISLFISWPLTTLLSLITSFTGLVIYAYFWKCDPIKQRYISKPDQILPYFVMKSLSSYPGLPGVIIAGVFSGALSSVSSFVNSLAAVTLEDYIKPYYRRNNLSHKSEVMISKCLVLFYGLLCVLLTYLVDRMVGLLQASLTIFGVVGGPLLMLFTAGVFFRTCNSNGALYGFITSLLFGLWIGFGNLLYGSKPIPLSQSTQLCANPLNFTITSRPSDISFSIYNLSYMWFAGLTWALGLLVAMIISKLTKSDDKINELLFTPWLRRETYQTNDYSTNQSSKSLVQNDSSKQTQL